LHTSKEDWGKKWQKTKRKTGVRTNLI